MKIRVQDLYGSCQGFECCSDERCLNPSWLLCLYFENKLVFLTAANAWVVFLVAPWVNDPI